MKNLKITILLAILALGIKVQADGLYDITFSDGSANVGFGQIDVENGFAVSGFFNVTSGLATGNWDLFTAGGNVAYPSTLTSPAGAFFYDNAVYLGSNPQYPSTSLFLDNSGLLFTDVSGNELNLWANADSTYSFYGVINNVRYDPDVIGASTIAPAPEPSSFAIALLLIPIGAFFYQRRAKVQ